MTEQRLFSGLFYAFTAAVLLFGLNSAPLSLSGDGTQQTFASAEISSELARSEVVEPRVPVQLPRNESNDHEFPAIVAADSAISDLGGHRRWIIADAGAHPVLRINRGAPKTGPPVV